LLDEFFRLLFCPFSCDRADGRRLRSEAHYAREEF